MTQPQRRLRRRITTTEYPPAAPSAPPVPGRPPPARPATTRVVPSPAASSRRPPSCLSPPGTPTPRPPANQTVRSTVLHPLDRAAERVRETPTPAHPYMGGGADGSVGDGPGRGEGGSRGSGGNGSGGSGSGVGKGEGIVIGPPSVAGWSTMSVRPRRAQDQTCRQLAIRAPEAGALLPRRSALGGARRGRSAPRGTWRLAPGLSTTGQTPGPAAGLLPAAGCPIVQDVGAGVCRLPRAGPGGPTGRRPI